MLTIFSALCLNLAEIAPGAGETCKQTKPGISPVFEVGAAKPTKIMGGKQ